LPSKYELQEIAHSRGRICKNRRCNVCAPLRELRHQKKAERKSETRTRLHAQGEPCGKQDCDVPACATARNTKPTVSDTVSATPRPKPAGEAPIDPEQLLRRQAERHRVGLPCGSETCPDKLCVDGFANERIRRHRARRPCRSAACETPLCVEARSSS